MTPESAGAGAQKVNVIKAVEFMGSKVDRKWKLDLSHQLELRMKLVHLLLHTKEVPLWHIRRILLKDFPQIQ